MATLAGRHNPDSITDLYGNSLVGSTVTVLDADGVTPSSLWSDKDRVTAVDNPYPVDDDGNIDFYLEPGLHFYEVREAGVLRITLEIVIPLHGDEPSGAANDQQSHTLVVAASDSTQEGKDGADYVCDGTADDVEIQQAIDALAALGGHVRLLEGHYSCAGPIDTSNVGAVTLSGQGITTILEWDAANWTGTSADSLLNAQSFWSAAEHSIGDVGSSVNQVALVRDLAIWTNVAQANVDTNWYRADVIENVNFFETSADTPRLEIGYNGRAEGIVARTGDLNITANGDVVNFNIAAGELTLAGGEPHATDGVCGTLSVQVSRAHVSSVKVENGMTVFGGGSDLVITNCHFVGGVVLLAGDGMVMSNCRFDINLTDLAVSANNCTITGCFIDESLTVTGDNNTFIANRIDTNATIDATADGTRWDSSNQVTLTFTDNGTNTSDHVHTDQVEIGIAATDETTAITAGTGKTTFRMPHAMTVTEVRASLTTAAATGTFTVDINEGGVSILSTKLTIDATEKTSTTAATPAVISDAALADDAEITVDVDDDGDGAATGLKVWLIGTRA